MDETIREKLKSIQGTRQKMMKATHYLFNQYGYARPTLREIAELSNIKKSSLYHYIDEKETLMVDALNRLTKRCRRMVFSKVKMDESSPKERWERFIHQIKAFFEEQGYCPLPAIYLEIKEKSPLLEEMIHHYYVVWIYEITQIFKPVLGEHAARRLAHRILAQLEGAQALDSIFGSHHYQEQFYEDMKQQGEGLFFAGGSRGMETGKVQKGV